MTTHTRSLLTFSLLVLTPAAGLIAQSKPTPLSAAEVSQLISRGEPADHARLSAHFTALADRQAADAKLHAAMQQSYSSSTKAAALNMANHCKALVSRSQQSAASMRELSAFHGKLAGGATIQAGIGLLEPAGPRPTGAELARLAASAETAADHRALGAYFTSMATRYEREAADHAAYAKTWRGLTRNAAAPTQAASHERVANELREAAKEARTAASMHGDEAVKAK
jgi:hypothetical protein